MTETPIVYWTGDSYRGIIMNGWFHPYIPLSIYNIKDSSIVYDPYPTRERMMREHPEFVNYIHEELPE